MAEETPADTGTSEAAQARQTIDTLKAEVTSLKENAVNLGKVRHVDRWVRGKGISDNATVDQWVDTIMPKANNLQFGDVAEIPSMLDANFGMLVQPPVVAPSDQTGTPAPPPAEGVVPTTPGQPANPADTAPGFATPNPGTAGQPPAGQQPYEYGDPFIQNLMRTEAGAKQVQELHEQNMIRWTAPDARYDKALQ